MNGSEIREVILDILSDIAPDEDLGDLKDDVSFREQMDIHIEHTWLILNRVPGEMPAALQERVDKMGIPFLGFIPADMKLMEFEFNGRPLVDLGDDSPVYKAIADMMQKLDL